MNDIDLEHFVVDETGEIYAGKHLIFDFWGVKPELCGDLDLIQNKIIQACEEAGATILGYNFHHFGEGFGVTGVVMLSESHASVHTWPEAGLMTFDVFMCGNAKPSAAMRYLSNVFKPSKTDNHDIHRGIIKPSKP